MRKVIVLLLIIVSLGAKIGYTTWVGDLKNVVNYYFNSISDSTTRTVSFNTTWAIHTDYKYDWQDYNLGVVQRIHISNRADGVRFRAEMFPTLLENHRAPSRYSSWFDMDLDRTITMGDDGWVYRYERYFKARPALDLVDDLQTRPGAIDAWVNALEAFGGVRRLTKQCEAVEGLDANCMPLNSLVSPRSEVSDPIMLILDVLVVVSIMASLVVSVKRKKYVY